MQLASEAGQRLQDRRETIAVVESSSGGLISAALLSVPGASKYFLGGSVVYTERARESLMGIRPSDMANMRSASEPYAVYLAETVVNRFQTDWGLAETGAAGPTGNRYGDAAGHCCLALAGAENESLVIKTGATDRFENMQHFSTRALELLLQTLK